MKNLLKSIALMIITLLVIFTACGGGGGGSSSGGGDGEIPAGMFTKEVAYSDGYVADSNLFSTTAFCHFQIYYKKDDIAGSGNINSIYLRCQTDLASAVSCSNVSIKLGHTSIADLLVDMTQNINQGKGSAVTVLNDATITIPAGSAGDYFEIPLTTSFNYNGVDDLIVDITRAAACPVAVSLCLGMETGNTYTKYRYSTNSSSPDNGNSGNISYLFHIQFKFAGGDNKVDYSMSPSINNFGPFTTDGDFNRVQVLYPAASIAGSGRITAIGLQLAEESAFYYSYKYTVRMGYSQYNSLGVHSWEDNFNQGSPVTVANSVNFVIPQGVPAGKFIWLSLNDGTFTYDGTGNLVIEITTMNATGIVKMGMHTTGSGQLAHGSSVDTFCNNVITEALQIALRFYGGTMDVITEENSNTGHIFNSDPHGRINLYRASELGTAGTITSVACRMHNNASAETDYANYRIIIGHCPLESLDSDPDNNFVSQLTAVNGTVSIPGGLVKGDWIEVPLSTPFVYDGKSNLAVWMGTTDTTGAGVTHSVKCTAIDSTQYAGQNADGIPGSVSVTPQDFKLDMKFKISK
ncbi:MAG: hypothetical protein JXN64_01580 [Spirochaetes bacterium]|nr:hypothetical protein [Spirochaetota bacterium]